MKKQKKTNSKRTTVWPDASAVAINDCAEEFTEIYGEDFLDEDGYLLDDEEEY
jgi:hypothetical protein